MNMAKVISKGEIVGVKELRENLEKYINRVNKGESFTVVRRSKPVFKISPAGEEKMCFGSAKVISALSTELKMVIFLSSRLKGGARKLTKIFNSHFLDISETLFGIIST